MTSAQRLACFGLLSFATACGGSASETPDPVRPDAWQFEARHHQLLAEGAAAGAPATEAAVEAAPRALPAQPTWGKGVRRKSSEAALPAQPSAGSTNPGRP